jgi:outer membrane protein OmpA-like peptidoglycan-associated protein
MYLYRFILFFLFVLFVPFHCFSQKENLVPNPSFEEYKELPSKIAQGLRCISKWTFPNFPGQGDYYHAKSKTKKASTKSNQFGNQKPHTGDAYAGICISEKVREYLQVELIHPLDKDKQYKVQLFISCADKLYLSTVSEFHIVFSKESFILQANDHLLAPPIIKFTNQKKYNNKNEWQELSIIYTANGTERYMTFGTFPYEEDELEYGKIFGKSKYAHYYVDDVSITPVIKEKPSYLPNVVEQKENASPNKNFISGETYVFENLQFETGKSILLPESFPELDNLILYLNKHPEIKLKITGHTDNVGNPSDNLKLSYERANTVMLYLNSNKAFQNNSISVEGKGDKIPLTSNDNDAGRKMNRRVEISFY